jgi:hypothetical protein
MASGFSCSGAGQRWLKTAGRDGDDIIKLERSEAMRAKDKGHRYLS